VLLFTLCSFLFPFVYNEVNAEKWKRETNGREKKAQRTTTTGNKEPGVSGWVVGLFCVHSFRFITSGRKWAREWSESEHSTNHPTNNEVNQKNKFKWNKSAHFTCLLFILNLVFCFSSYSSCLLVVFLFI